MNESTFLTCTVYLSTCEEFEIYFGQVSKQLMFASGSEATQFSIFISAIFIGAILINAIFINENRLNLVHSSPQASRPPPLVCLLATRSMKYRMSLC